MDGEGKSPLEWTFKVKQSQSSSKNSSHSKDTLVDEIKLAHEELPLAVGQTQVLILEDQPFTASGPDALISVERREDELAAMRTAMRLKRQQYSPFEDEELMVTSTVSGTQPKRLLAHYDEDERGAGRGFSTLKTLDELRTSTTLSSQKFTETVPSSTVQPILPARRNIRRKLVTFSDEPKPIPAKSAPLDASPLTWDDNDLQLSLAMSRKRAAQALLPPIQREIDSIDSLDIVNASETGQPMQGFVFSEATEITLTRAEDSETVQQLSKFPTVAVKTRLDLTQVPDKDIVPIEREPLVRRGMAATLQFLAKLGIRPQLCSEREPPKQRKPEKRFMDLKVEHYDEEGNLLTPKEAYKLLSHQFHGKAPGKAKQEKKLQKRAHQQRLQAAPLTDTPLGMASALRERQKATGASHIVLSQGGRAAIDETNAMPIDQVQRGATATAGGTKKQQPKTPGANVKKIPKIFGMK